MPTLYCMHTPELCLALSTVTISDYDTVKVY